MSEEKTQDTYITAREAAKELNVSPFLIQRRIRDGILPGLRMMGKGGKKATYRIKRSDFDEFIRQSSSPEAMEE
jgi:excisionase family DNA binding protein